MTVKILRAVFFLACAILGGFWAHYIVEQFHEGQHDFTWSVIGVLIGGGVACVVLWLVSLITQDVFERISPAIIAIALSVVVGFVLSQWILEMYFPEETDRIVQTFVMCSFVLVFGFIGVMLGLTRASNWESLIRAVHRQNYRGAGPKLVDTSVIIDGRLADICKTGFIEGTLLVPRFVLKELQNIADSSEVLRRARGRRGLDILKILQEPGSRVVVEVIEDDPIEVPEVDGKLIRLARDYSAKIITNDLNLNKVAQIDGVDVLNINDLANALKPAVLPDETMEVRIVKQGKEALQGVGYLDDGTMVVVDGGRNYVGKDVAVVVTSVLQTTAGRMIFTKLQNVVS